MNMETSLEKLLGNMQEEEYKLECFTKAFQLILILLNKDRVCLAGTKIYFLIFDETKRYSLFFQGISDTKISFILQQKITFLNQV